jgi:hypothetical protein
MFDNPEITRQLVEGRIHQRRNEATRRRIAVPARRPDRSRLRLRMTPTTWFVRRRRNPCLPDHATA